MVLVEELHSGGCVVTTEGLFRQRVQVFAEEAEVYRATFALADGDGDGLVSEAEGVAFLRRALSGREAERVWRLAVSSCEEDTVEALDVGGWLLACKLAAAAQQKERDPTSEEVTLSKLCDPLADAVIPGIADFGAVAANFRRDGDASRQLEVRVTSPQLVGEGPLGQYTVYSVRTRTDEPFFAKGEMRVSRRFSDFEWCHDRLRVACPGVVVPPLLASKRWTNNTHHDFVRDRMESLTRFCNRVAAHPVLRRSLAFHALVDATPDGLLAAKGLDPLYAVKPLPFSGCASSTSSTASSSGDSSTSWTSSLSQINNNSNSNGAAFPKTPEPDDAPVRRVPGLLTSNFLGEQQPTLLTPHDELEDDDDEDRRRDNDARRREAIVAGVVDDVNRECARYGTVADVLPQPNGKDVKILFNLVDNAAHAVADLSYKTFDGHPCRLAFLPTSDDDNAAGGSSAGVAGSGGSGSGGVSGESNDHGDNGQQQAPPQQEQP
mmetsp:Transcript_17087/g.51884  ORF Transcript_17087/g.51884 Transcript_17087/m.51884 type:complete len:492 (+) Transcript_17087:107-1582(+)